VEEEKYLVWKINKFTKYPVNSWKWKKLVSSTEHDELIKMKIGEGEVNSIETEN